MDKRIRNSRRQETRASKLYGGSRNSGSGNGTWRKNDVRTDDLSIELKYTDKKSYSLKLAELQEAEKNALLDNGRNHLFGISFAGENYVVMPEHDYLIMREAAQRGSESED